MNDISIIINGGFYEKSINIRDRFICIIWHN